MTAPKHAPSHVILIVDDQPENLAVLASLLNPHYSVRAARSGEQALRAAAMTPLPDLILLDIMMPGMSGFDVLAKLREESKLRDIPVIFITALSAEDDEQKGLDQGAVDYISKPINPGIVLSRVRTQLELKQARDTLTQHKVMLESEVAERTKALKQTLDRLEDAHEQLKKTHFSTLMAIGELAELRGSHLGEHCRRVADISRQVAFRMRIAANEAQDIFIAALLHDVGKIGFSDQLLDKPVSLMNSDGKPNKAWQSALVGAGPFAAIGGLLGGIGANMTGQATLGKFAGGALAGAVMIGAVGAGLGALTHAFTKPRD